MTLIGYWPLNETSGDTAHDHSGKENHGTINGATTGKTGITGKNAYQFNGSGDDVTTNISFDIAGSTGFTINAWIYPHFSQGHSTNRAVAHWFPDKDNNWILRYRHGSGGWAWGWSNTNKYKETGHSANTWYMYTMTVDSSGNLRGYWNTKQQVTASVGSASWSSSTMWIGNDYWGEPWDGKISELRVYNHALTPQEIQYLYSVSQRGRYISQKKKA